MDPFLSNIRFLTMNDEFLKGYVYPKQLLTEEEVNAIQHYKVTSDKSIIPDSISRSHLSRNHEKHSFCKETIRIRIKNCIYSDGLKIERQYEINCDENGYAKLNRVIYIRKSSIVRVIAEINDDDIVRGNIRIGNLANRYILYEGMAISSEETFPLSKDIEYIYCNVKLYF
ncbi:uncharacterized protein LOC111622052 [Centruroides sculpturatus]|uniref:uncharacterized protein LOC111622052 n=1 Tax=Centruroides sculpturatus TaxID=218467 RepID=UPI000C6D8176|nr:uncharacterized protein LOC111622052 [Centruroides sculpturatus]